MTRAASDDDLFHALIAYAWKMHDDENPFSVHLAVDGHRAARDKLVARGDEVLGLLTRTLARAEPAVRHEAVMVLIGLELTPRVVEALEQAASHSDSIVSDHATTRLSQRAPTGAYEMVAKRIAEQPQRGGQAVAVAFVMDPARALRDAASWAACEHVEVRRALAKELVSHAHADCVETLQRLAADTDPSVHRPAFVTLARVAPAAAGATLAPGGPLEAWKKTTCRPDFEPLIDVLASRTVSAETAAEAIAYGFASGDLYATEASAKLAIRRDIPRRAHALAEAPYSLAEREVVRALARLGSAGLEAMIDAAGREGPHLGLLAQRIASANPTHARTRLASAVADQGQPGRATLLTALALLGGGDALMAVVADPTDPDHAAAVFAACKAGHDDAWVHLEFIVRGQDEAKATTALGLMLNHSGPPASTFDDLVRWGHTSRYKPLLFLVVRALRELGDPRARPTLQRLVDHGARDVGEQARKALTALREG